MNNATIATLATLVLLGQLVACGGGGGGSATDTTAPTATVATDAPAAPDPALIPEYAVITITFSERMDAAGGAWHLGGDLAGESNGGVWSTTTVANDTLTISPAGSWFAKPGRTLTVDARDLAGNPLAPLSLTYDIYRGLLYYVDASRPDDYGDGQSPLTAREFIHTAVADATPSATVLVNAGDYRLSNQLGTQVVLRQDVSLYGGYNADFTARDPATNITTIEDRSTTGGSSGAPRAAIVGSGSITSVTVVDGFAIQGSTQGAAATAAILLSNGAAPRVQNNALHGGGGSSASYAVYNSAASPVLQGNTINGGSATSASFGVFNDNSANPAVFNNSIHGGSGANFSWGIINVNSSATIRNNTIYSGDGSSATGVSNSGATSQPSHPRIDNNIIFARSGAGAYCVYESGESAGDANPASLHNNNLWNCAGVYYDDAAGCGGNADGDNNAYTCALSEVNSLTDIPSGVGANVSANPQFADIDGPDNLGSTMADNDWRFSAGSPASVTAGGLNGRDQATVWIFTTDKDGKTRPATGNPWAIGAYEP